MCRRSALLVALAVCSVVLVALVKRSDSQNCCSNPGVLAGITPQGLNDIAAVGASLLQSKLHGSSLNIGSVQGVQFSDSRISSFNVVTFSLNTSPSGLKLKVSFDITGSASYNYRKCYWIFCVTLKGSVSMRSSVMLTLVLNVGNNGGKYTLGTSQCDATISKLDVTFSGGNSILDAVLNGLKNAFKGQLTSILQRQVCPAVTTVVKTKGSEVLQSFNTSTELYPGIFMNYSLLDSVITGSDFATSKLKGEVYCSETGPKTCTPSTLNLSPTPTATIPPTTATTATTPTVPTTQPPPTKKPSLFRRILRFRFGKRSAGQNRLIRKISPSSISCPTAMPVEPESGGSCPYYIRISEYTFNSALEALYDCGHLQESFCMPNNITKLVNILLTLVSFSPCNTNSPGPAIFPAQCSNKAFSVNATGPPTVKLSGGKVILSIDFGLDLLKTPGCSVCHLYGTVSTEISATIKTTPSGQHILIGKAHALTISINVTTLCPFLQSGFVQGVLQSGGIPDLDHAINFLGQVLVLPKLNEMLARGIPLAEVDHLTLTSPTLHLHNGYSTACFNVAYTS